MTAAPLILTLFIYASQWWTPAVAPYYKGKTHLKVIGKIKWLSHELLHDIIAQEATVQHIRDQYHKSLQYQLGDLVYDMRFNFKRMVQLYLRTDKMLSYKKYDHNENIRRMLLVHRWGLDIQGKTLMIQAWQKKTETLEQQRIRMNSPLRSGLNRFEDELPNEPFYDVVVRERMMARERMVARAGQALGPPSASPARPAGKRKNSKWRHVRNSDFAP